ncbi:hypothetical protein SAMN05444062_104323 [Pseudomonas syringae]|nr:hypothetical protein SAMN05444062_104323 [Pseudomonas syringae]
MFAKTVVQAMHVRKAWRPLRRQVRSYARWAESKTAFCPRGRGELVREDGRSGDACSKAWRPLRGQVRSYARWAESKTAFCPRGRGELVREDGRSGDACSKAWRPLRRQVRSYARWAESKRPPARGVGANLFAKTVVLAMHVRRLGDPFADKSSPTPVRQNQNGLLPEG